MSSYVILQPHSNTNPTDKYRVADFDDWVKAEYTLRSFALSDHDDYESARIECDRLNEAKPEN